MNIQPLFLLSSAIFFLALALIIAIKRDIEGKNHKLTAKENTTGLKEDFTNMIVHELRAPLISIKDSSELIMSSNYNLQEVEKKQFLEIINKQSRLLLDQIQSILDSAKLQSGLFTIDRTKEDIGKLIKEQIALFLPQATKKNIALTGHIPVSLPRILLDPMRMGQVMNNLLSNGLKFTPSGGRIDVLLEYTSSPRTRNITVRVKDTGIGIAKEEQKKLFGKFSQVNSQKIVKQGTGLGLYVIKGIIEAHGGAVSLESTLGKGTTVSFTLPVADGEK